MPTIDEVITEVEELLPMTKGLEDILPNRYVDQVERVHDIIYDHAKYMGDKFTGKKFYNQEFEQQKKVKIPKSLIKTMHQDSISCMKKNPNDKYHKNKFRVNSLIN